MKKYFSKDTICALVLIAFGCWWEWGATLIPEREFDNGLSAAYMPKLLGGCLLVLSAIYLIQSLLKARKEHTPEKTDSKRHLTAVGLMVSLALYALLFKAMGFILTTFLFLFGSMSYLCRPKDGKKPNLKYFLQYLVIAALMTAVLYLLFGVGFKISLPTLWLA